jgi:tetratricopeptide (TPR) repeat protein
VAAAAPLDGLDAADAAARLLADQAQAIDEALNTPQRLALAWALKEACLGAWHTDPARTQAAAQRLGELAAGSAGQREIDALAAWTGAIADLARGAMSEAVVGLDCAAALFETLGQAQHAAQTQVPKIMALSMLGQYDEATACAEVTLRALTQQGDTASAAKLSQNMGSLHMHRDAYAAAAHHYREAAVMFARSGQMRASVMADIGLADANTAQGDFDAATLMYARARQRAVHHDLPVLAAIVDESTAVLDLARGRYGAALAGLERARRGYEALAMPQYLAIVEKQLADAYLELRLLPEAMSLYDAALPRFDALEMLPERAWTLAQRGRTLALMGRPDEAANVLQAAADLFSAQDNAVGAAAVALARGELKADRGDPHGALAQAQVAAAGFVAARQAEGQLRADLVCAQAWLALGDLAQAESGFAACLDRAQELCILPPQVRALTGQGLVARATGRRAVAQRAFEAAASLFEDQRRTLSGDEFRHAWLTDHLRPYRELLALALAPEAGSSVDPAAVLLHLERVRARSLGERLTGAVPDEANPELPALRGRLNWLYRRLRKVQDEGGESQALMDELHDTERNLLEGVRRERLAADKAATTEGGDNSIDLSALCQALGAADALVEYGVSGDELFACIVRRQGVQIVRHLAHWPGAQEAAQSLRFQIDTLRHGSAPVARHLSHLEKRATQRLQQLHGLLWAPLAESLAGCKRVLVVPHAQLASLPFAALHDGQGPIGARLQLALAPSARVALHGLLHPAREPVAAQARALVLGESTRLPQAGSEARHVASLFSNSVCLIDEAATLEALRTEAPTADVLHLACHAQFRSDNPLFSALHLRDGAVTAEWLQGLSLNQAVVVLSACETGLAEQGQGDEMVGLVRAFLVAGASRVVAALWPVDDAVTEAFMGTFYRELVAGALSASALQRAQSSVMQAHPHPYYWAGFVLQGGW